MSINNMLLSSYYGSGLTYFGSYSTGGFPGAHLTCNAIDTNGKMYMAGNYTSTATTGGSNILISRVTSQGVIDWSYVSSTAANVFCDSIVIDSGQSNFYVAGRFGGRYFIQKYSTSDGSGGTLTPVWQRSFGRFTSNTAYNGQPLNAPKVCMVVESTGTYLTVGYTEMTSSNAYFIKHYTSNGALLSQNQLTSTYFGNAASAIPGANSFYISDMAISSNSSTLDQIAVTGGSYINVKPAGGTTLYSYGAVIAQLNNSGSTLSLSGNPTFIYSSLSTSAAIYPGGIAFDNTSSVGGIYVSLYHNSGTNFYSLLGFLNPSISSFSSGGVLTTTAGKPIFNFSVAVPPTSAGVSTNGVFGGGWDTLTKSSVLTASIMNLGSGVGTLYNYGNFNFSPDTPNLTSITPNIVSLKTDGSYLYFVGTYEAPASSAFPRAFFGKIPIGMSKTGTYTLPDSTSLTYTSGLSYSASSGSTTANFTNPASFSTSTTVLEGTAPTFTFSPVTISDIII